MKPTPAPPLPLEEALSRDLAAWIAAKEAIRKAMAR